MRSAAGASARKHRHCDSQSVVSDSTAIRDVRLPITCVRGEIARNEHCSDLRVDVAGVTVSIVGAFLRVDLTGGRCAVGRSPASWARQPRPVAKA